VDQAQLDAIEDNYYHVVPTIPEGATAMETDAEALARAVTNPKKGDIAVCERIIGGVSSASSMTAYMYNGSAWQALDGNYSAENVYFDQDLMTTTAIGNITLTGGQATISAAGKNLVDVFNTIYVKEDAAGLKVSSPTVQVSDETTTYYEIGKTGTKNITVSMKEDGSYEYGYTSQALNEGETATSVVNNGTTGVTVTANTPFELYLDGVSQTPTTTNGNVFTLAPAAKNDRGSCTMYAKMNYQDGGIPVSNLKKAYPAQKIGASYVYTKTNSTTVPTGDKLYTSFAWYVPFFQGFTTDANVIADPANITATQLTTALTAPVSGSTNTATKVTGSTAYSKTKLTKAVAPAAWRQYFLAYPKSWSYDMSGAKDGNNIDCTVWSAKDVTVNINGVDVVYAVYYINNATAYGTKTITWTVN
jgi:hypothetical protein